MSGLIGLSQNRRGTMFTVFLFLHGFLGSGIQGVHFSSRGLPVMQEGFNENDAEGWQISSNGLPVVQETSSCRSVLVTLQHCIEGLSLAKNTHSSSGVYMLATTEDILPGWTRSGLPLIQATTPHEQQRMNYTDKGLQEYIGISEEL